MDARLVLRALLRPGGIGTSPAEYSAFAERSRVTQALGSVGALSLARYLLEGIWRRSRMVAAGAGRRTVPTDGRLAGGRPML